MADLHFTWDAAKARANLSKHGISFAEAETVFSDDKAILLPDPDHSESEERFVLIGLSAAFAVARRRSLRTRPRSDHSTHLGPPSYPN